MSSPCYRLRPDFQSPVSASGLNFISLISAAGDLKSDNIFVNGSAGIVKIGDLGFATLRGGMSVVMSVIGEEAGEPALPAGEGTGVAVDEADEAEDMRQLHDGDLVGNSCLFILP